MGIASLLSALRPSQLARPERLPYLAGVAGALFIAFSAILVRLADVAPATAAVFRPAFALPVLALLAARERARWGPRPRRDRLIALAAGVFFAGDLLFWHYAIAAVGAGLATVLGNTQVVFVGLAAWVVLGERPRRQVLVAVPVVLTGVVLISGALGNDAYGADPAAGVVFGVLTAITYAGFLLLLRQGNRDTRRPAGPLFDASLSAAVTAIMAGLLIGDVDLSPSWPAVGWLVALALNSQVVGWLLISLSLPRLPALVTSIVLLLQPVGSVLLGMVLLGEEPSAAQLAGVAVVLSGVILATGQRRRTTESSAPVLPAEPAVPAPGVTAPGVTAPGVTAEGATRG